MRTEILKFIKSNVIMLVSSVKKQRVFNYQKGKFSHTSSFIAQDKEMNCKCIF